MLTTRSFSYMNAAGGGGNTEGDIHMDHNIVSTEVNSSHINYRDFGVYLIYMFVLISKHPSKLPNGG